MQTENKYREELSRQKSEYRQLIERHTAEQVSFKEALRKELAEVYMEKFSAMAAELSHVHKVKYTPLTSCFFFLTWYKYVMRATQHLDKMYVCIVCFSSLRWLLKKRPQTLNTAELWRHLKIRCYFWLRLHYLFNFNKRGKHFM